MGWEADLTCVFRPAAGPRSGGDPPEVRVALRPADLITSAEPDGIGRTGTGIANPALAVRYCCSFEPNLARPATCLAYTWLAEDLQDLG